MGALGIRTAAHEGLPTSDYGVVRLKRSLSPGARVGGSVMTGSAEEDGGDDHNLVYGGDADVRLPWGIDLSAFALGTEPSRRRSFRVPPYPFDPPVFCISAGYLVYASVRYAGAGALPGPEVLAASLPVLWVAERGGESG